MRGDAKCKSTIFFVGEFIDRLKKYIQYVKGEQTAIKFEETLFDPITSALSDLEKACDERKTFDNKVSLWKNAKQFLSRDTKNPEYIKKRKQTLEAKYNAMCNLKVRIKALYYAQNVQNSMIGSKKPFLTQEIRLIYEHASYNLNNWLNSKELSKLGYKCPSTGSTISQAEGESEGESESEGEGKGKGKGEGKSEGEGESEGEDKGESKGEDKGESEGEDKGESEGATAPDTQVVKGGSKPRKSRKRRSTKKNVKSKKRSIRRRTKK